MSKNKPYWKLFKAELEEWINGDGGPGDVIISTIKILLVTMFILGFALPVSTGVMYLIGMSPFSAVGKATVLIVTGIAFIGAVVVPPLSSTLVQLKSSQK